MANETYNASPLYRMFFVWLQGVAVTTLAINNKHYSNQSSTLLQIFKYIKRL